MPKSHVDLSRISDKRSIQNSINIGYLLIFIQSLIFIFLFPNMEYPDAMFHLQRAFVNSSNEPSIYFKLVNGYREIIEVIFGINFKVQLMKADTIHFFSLKNYMTYDIGNNLQVSVLQLYNLFLIFTSIFLFNLIVKRDKKADFRFKRVLLRVNLLYHIYPAVSYLLMGITSDYFNYLYQPFFIYFIYTRRNILNFVLMIVIFNYFDQGIVVNLIFLTIYLLNSIIIKHNKKKDRIRLLVVNLILLIFVYFLSRILINVVDYKYYLLETAKYLQDNYGNSFTKVINFVLSSFCLWGVGNYITFPLLYLIYLLIIMKIVKKSIIDNDEKECFFNYLITSIITISVVIAIYPPYSHIRFFLFFIFFIIIGFQYYIRNDKYFLSEKAFLAQALVLFFHNVFLILFYSIKIFVFM